MDELKRVLFREQRSLKGLICFGRELDVNHHLAKHNSNPCF